MSEEMLPRFDHQTTEPKIYELWEKSGFFNPDNLKLPKNAKPFTIIMPPPNANGALHIGHAVFITLQDIMIRFARMRGRKTLWLPGADHAGFETQVVFDKKLEKEGRNRFAMNREELWREMWEFTQKNKGVMEGQLRKLGASCDWSRKKFTLDPAIVEEVDKTFVILYEDGLIYRDIRIVNWCPKHKTALSDLEVKYIERVDPLYYMKYGPLTLATVRPETKFGDTALAVNPKDKRYTKYVGKEIEAKGLLGPLKLRIIADDAVDRSFGTGVVKVTPAHDSVDFEIWQRHKNEIAGPKVIIDENGRLTGETGPFKGLRVAEAREKVAAAMQQVGILEKIDPDYKHQIATCYKCGTTLEPLPRSQWFVKIQPLAKPAIAAVKNGKVKFYPERTKKIYFHWLKNIRDWNISRQIAWGIRIPAWFCMSCGETKMNLKIKSRWFLVRHGETDWNKEERAMGQADIPLNKIGRAQVKNSSEFFRSEKIDLIISSDLSRCRTTAETIARITKAEIIFDKNLRERHEGNSQGMLVKERDEIYKNIFDTYEGKLNDSDSESFKEVEGRVWRTFKNHGKKHRHKNVVIVTHAGPIKGILKQIKNLDFDRARHDLRIKNAEIIPITIAEPCKKCGNDFYEQDPDVFDTWFSSGQWPYLALGFKESSPAKSEKLKVKSDFEKFYPTDVMETGYDILFFWVARMMMLGIYRTGKIPFENVYLHGMVRDKDRQKMSKSKGNAIDPLGVTELYGADAVRMALVAGNTAGNDIVISEDKIRGYRNFTTKIWNAARFILMNKPPTGERRNSASSPQQYTLTKEDKKNLADLIKLKVQMTKHLQKFEFHLASEKIYHYFWHTFADKIIENCKPRLRVDFPGEEIARLRREDSADRSAAYYTLESILAECLKMLHPFMPFVTEEIYQKIYDGKILMTEKW